MGPFWIVLGWLAAGTAMTLGKAWLQHRNTTPPTTARKENPQP